MDYGEEFNALVGGGIGTGHLTLTKKLMVVQNKHQDPPDNNDERRENTLATRSTAALTAIRSMTM